MHLAFLSLFGCGKGTLFAKEVLFKVFAPGNGNYSFLFTGFKLVAAFRTEVGIGFPSSPPAWLWVIPYPCLRRISIRYTNKK
jgi:hypothetical protein